MTNFDFLLSDPQFTVFGEVAVAAEKIYTIDPAACALNCRRCMEFAVKWMYSVDGGLVMPYDDRLASLMDTEDFRAIVDRDLWQRLKYIRQTGNAAAHTSRKIAPEQARLCLENLWYFMDFIACCYGRDLSLGDMAMIVLTATLASVGTAGTPGAGMIMLAMVLEAIGIPVAYIGLIVAVDRLFDMGRTCLNVTGDIACSLCVTKWESKKK